MFTGLTIEAAGVDMGERGIEAVLSQGADDAVEVEHGDVHVQEAALYRREIVAVLEVIHEGRHHLGRQVRHLKRKETQIQK
jgi:hypothetical protein